MLNLVIKGSKHIILMIFFLSQVITLIKLGIFFNVLVAYLARRINGNFSLYIIPVRKTLVFQGFRLIAYIIMIRSQINQKCPMETPKRKNNKTESCEPNWVLLSVYHCAFSKRASWLSSSFAVINMCRREWKEQ